MDLQFGSICALKKLLKLSIEESKYIFSTEPEFISN